MISFMALSRTGLTVLVSDWRPSSCSTACTALDERTAVACARIIADKHLWERLV